MAKEYAGMTTLILTETERVMLFQLLIPFLKMKPAEDTEWEIADQLFRQLTEGDDLFEWIARNRRKPLRGKLRLGSSEHTFLLGTVGDTLRLVGVRKKLKTILLEIFRKLQLDQIPCDGQSAETNDAGP
ncbi:MAG: hypothetical protein HGA31_04150 [Candidatus Moranbacteria bacterium]|nr:hypothetical protein [Candidatus Moranbacteria bacterium]